MSFLFKLAAVGTIIYAAVIGDRRAREAQGEDRIPFDEQDDDDGMVMEADVLIDDGNLAARPNA